MEKEEKNEVDEIVESTIKNFDEMPFGITADEFETQEDLIEESDGDLNDTNKNK